MIHRAEFQEGRQERVAISSRKAINKRFRPTRTFRPGVKDPLPLEPMPVLKAITSTTCSTRREANSDQVTTSLYPP